MPAHKRQRTRVPLPNNRRHSPQPAGVGGESTKPAARSAVETMRNTLRAAAGHAVYEMREAAVESVFRQIKERRRFARLLVPKARNNRGRMADYMPDPNLLKLFRAAVCPQPA